MPEFIEPAFAISAALVLWALYGYLVWRGRSC